MKHILIVGAGRSTSSLIKYLLRESASRDWTLTVGDLAIEWAEQKVAGAANATAIRFDVTDVAQCEAEVQKADLVISMLPARFHHHLAGPCVKYGKHLLTASYVNDEIQAFDTAAKEKGILILMECGLDPGIDHMSAMRVMDQIKNEGGELVRFETFTGGLLSPESCTDNPWEYKFTWNPRNVVLAGQGVVKFIQEGKYKYYPYNQLFRRTEMLHIPGYGYFEGLANRDSLKYLDVYNLRGIRTLYRGTMRRPGFCRAWDIFVQLGATDDTYEMDDVSKMTHRDFINSFLSYDPHNSVELKLAHYLNLDLECKEMFMLKWLGMFAEDLIGLERGTPAQIMEHILKKKWTISPEDRDMITMLHIFDFMDKGKHRRVQSHMVVIGEDEIHTGMSKTVGLPMGIAAKMILTGQIKETGVHIPVLPGIYNPILDELKREGIDFVENEIPDEGDR
ncbi:saccharopine dehydrogenase NADP-binding domain-containing protein [bacterium]|nr:saccharopine dehydrogenase NADP-binding domain-containing protein [bacterium]